MALIHDFLLYKQLWEWTGSYSQQLSLNCALIHFNQKGEGQANKCKCCCVKQCAQCWSDFSPGEAPDLTLWTACTTTTTTAPLCGKCLIPAPMYKHTTQHNTSSSPWCHSVIPRLRLTSLPNLIAVIMAWRWNKRAELSGGCALHACQTCCATAWVYRLTL